MEWITILIIGGQIVFFGGCFLLLIYLAIKRIEDEKLEDFEDREN